MLYFLCLIQLLTNNYQDVKITIDIPQNVSSEDTVMITGTLSNETDKDIIFYEFQLFESLYRGNGSWEIKITKENKEYFVPIILFQPTKLPERVRLKKHSVYQFQIPVSFRELMNDRWTIENSKTSIYQLQLRLTLFKPKDIKIESNIVEFVLSADNE